MNHAWHDPQTGGQGFFIIVYPELGKMFAALFTFDSGRPPADLSRGALSSRLAWRPLVAIKYARRLGRRARVVCPDGFIGAFARGRGGSLTGSK